MSTGTNDRPDGPGLDGDRFNGDLADYYLRTRYGIDKPPGTSGVPCQEISPPDQEGKEITLCCPTSVCSPGAQERHVGSGEDLQADRCHDPSGFDRLHCEADTENGEGEEHEAYPVERVLQLNEEKRLLDVPFSRIVDEVLLLKQNNRWMNIKIRKLDIAIKNMKGDIYHFLNQVEDLEEKVHFL